jgi:hypothetical protein
MFDWLFRRGKSDVPETPLARVTARVMRNGKPEDRRVPVPLLTLEEFFEGNDETGSIGCNLDSCPEPKDFYNLLMPLRARDDVSDIRIQITCVDDPGKQWPFSDTIWIMTSADEDTVRSWFPTHLAPDDCSEGWPELVKFEAIEVAKGHHPVGIWFD